MGRSRGNFHSTDEDPTQRFFFFFFFLKVSALLVFDSVFSLLVFCFCCVFVCVFCNVN